MEYLSRIFVKNVHMKFFFNVLQYFSNINVGDGQKEKTDDDSYDSSKTQSYVTSNEDDSDEFDTSDNEPLSKEASQMRKTTW